MAIFERKTRILQKLEQWNELEKVRKKIADNNIPYKDIKKESNYFAAMLYVNYSNFRSSMKAIKELDNYVDKWIRDNS